MTSAFPDEKINIVKILLTSAKFWVGFLISFMHLSLVVSGQNLRLQSLIFEKL